jgi:hypothetical protein
VIEAARKEQSVSLTEVERGYASILWADRQRATGWDFPDTQRTSDSAGREQAPVRIARQR